MIDMRGKTFGRLTVLAMTEHRNANRNILWLCRCTCGRIVEEDGYNLRHVVVKSCGCLRKESSATRIRQIKATKTNIGNREAFKDEYGNPIQAIKIGKRNTSGVIGVSYDKKNQKWVARLMIKGTLVLNNSFADFESAIAARKTAESKYLKKLI
ncbi:AP2 domain-containing protein [Pediococcus acidilactici]|nr:AP2 domain-containing protein [Pediococcus acidilactici]KAF0366023.1 AP2 domain-containing protein [Pediococcus acidilactici]KAF0416969.1 AP2 domain-containing protein [Pediococcus acidilactici]KAF0420582.1 AP2 domain-containing protein [Pediococcus acidilactici]KAF0472556.1 AP2 domain-containing protein [Pediococcus acidilactici]